MTPRRVVIAGMYAPYPGPFDGVEVWGVNRTYTQQDGLSRIYFLDGLDGFVSEYPEFVPDINDLGVPVYARRHYDEIPLSRPYPREDVMRAIFGDAPWPELEGRGYFTSSLAYMLAHAISEGVPEIVLHRVLVSAASAEYMMQKACLDFWCGIAIGRGHRLLVSEDSDLCRPVPWEPRWYGYEHNLRFHDANNAITSALRAAIRIPVEMRPALD